MIDYEKLKIIHSLAEKYRTNNVGREVETVTSFSGDDCSYFISIKEGEKIIFDWDYRDADDAITKLRELAEDEPKPKYRIGQKVWFTDKKDIFNFIIYKITGDAYYDESYKFGIHESQLYPSSKSLIDAQIEYWTKLKLESMEPKFEGEIGKLEPLPKGEIVYKYSQCVGGCKWDGILVSRNPNIGKCAICKNECFIALDKSSNLEKCAHESDAIMHMFTDDGGSFTMNCCRKCGVFYK